MALLVCEGCSAAYAVGLPSCPQCGSSKRHPDWEETMPKTTIEGPSFEEGKEPPGYAPPAPLETPAPPPASAPKADHVAYAAEVLGVPQDQAEQMTKAELAEQAQASAPSSAPRPAPAPKGDGG